MFGVTDYELSQGVFEIKESFRSVKKRNESESERESERES